MDQLGEVIISADKTLLDLDFIHHYLSKESYWAKDRSLETIKKSILNSYCFGVYHNGQQVGFARVITDCAVFAYIADVFIDPAYRGHGLSKLLMRTILGYPDFGDVKWTLRTLDAHGLYAQFGFGPPLEPDRVMDRELSA